MFPAWVRDLVGVVGELDAARLAPATDLHLRLDDDRVAGLLGLGDGLVDGLGHATRADGDAEAGEVLLALVLEQIHGRPSPLGLAARGTLRGARGAEQPAGRAPARHRCGQNDGVPTTPAAQFGTVALVGSARRSPVPSFPSPAASP